MSQHTDAASVGRYIPSVPPAHYRDTFLMMHSPPVFQLLYVSTLADGCDFSVVREVFEISRRRNGERRLTGALVFDGGHFGQLLEGTESDVTAMMCVIERDARHAQIQQLHAGAAPAGRLWAHWAAGYCEPHELDPLHGPGALTDRPALARFESVLAAADLA